MRIFVTLLFLLGCIAPTITSAQQKSEPEHKLIQFQMVLLKRGPKWTGKETDEAVRLEQQHRSFVNGLLESGKATITGSLNDNGEIRGVYIFRAPSAAEARAWADTDPAVQSGYLVVEMHPWWAEDVLKKPGGSLKTETAYLAFLSHGPKWTPEKTPATEELQKAHLANIYKLARMKKLAVAGPFRDNGNLAGIFVFRLPSLDEAKEFAATDPAVKTRPHNP